jgi:hypothetical protein
MPTRKPRARRSVRNSFEPAPGEFIAPRTFYRWLEAREFRLSPEDYNHYENVRDEAVMLAKAIDEFQGRHGGNSTVLSREEDVALGNAKRVFRTMLVPASMVKVVERKMPVVLPRSR